jgi:hypothetical protein
MTYVALGCLSFLFCFIFGGAGLKAVASVLFWIIGVLFIFSVFI